MRPLMMALADRVPLQQHHHHHHHHQRHGSCLRSQQTRASSLSLILQHRPCSDAEHPRPTDVDTALLYVDPSSRAAAMAWTPSHRPSQSSVSSLAHPLSPYLTLRLQSSFLYSGLADAFQYPRVLEALKSNPHIQASMVKCALLQCLVLGCVLGLDFLLLPAWTRGNTEGKLTMEPSTARFYYEVCRAMQASQKGVLFLTDFLLLKSHSTSTTLLLRP